MRLSHLNGKINLGNDISKTFTARRFSSPECCTMWIILISLSSYAFRQWTTTGQLTCVVQSPQIWLEKSKTDYANLRYLECGVGCALKWPDNRITGFYSSLQGHRPKLDGDVIMFPSVSRAHFPLCDRVRMYVLMVRLRLFDRLHGEQLVIQRRIRCRGSLTNHMVPGRPADCFNK